MSTLKIVITILCVLFTSSVSMAQSAISDSIYALAVEKYRNYDYSLALNLFQKCDSIDYATMDEASNRRDYAKMWMASCHYKMGDIEKAMEISPEYYKTEPIDRRKTVVSDSLSAIGMKFFSQEDYEEALDQFIECALIEKDSLGNSSNLANSLEYCMICCIETDDYDNVALFASSLYEVTKDVYGIGSDEYLNSLFYLSKALELTYRYDDAIKYENEYLSAAIVANCDEISIISSRRRLSRYYSKMGDYHNAIMEEKAIMDICELIDKSEEKDNYYSIALTNISLYNALLGYRDLALEQIGESEILIRRINNPNSLQFARFLDIKATIHQTIGLTKEAIVISNKSLEIKKSLPDCPKNEIDLTSGNLATYLSEEGYYTQAIDIINQVLKDTEGNSPSYATNLLNLGETEAKRGNRGKALEIFAEALSIYKKTIGKEGPQYIECLFKLSDLSARMNDIQVSIQFAKECKELTEDVYGQESKEYAKILRLYASILNDNLINNRLSLEYANKAVKIYQNILGADSEECLGAKEILAECLYNNGQIDKSIELSMSIIEDSQKKGDECPHLFWNYLNIAFDLSRSSNYKQAIDYWQKALENVKTTMSRKYGELTDAEYEKLSSEIQSYFLYLLPYYATQNIDSEEWRTLDYNASLFAKNFLLESSINNLSDWSSISYKTIAGRLTPTDVGIEFQTVPEDDSISLYALIAKNSYSSPKLLRICSLDTLQSVIEISKTDNRIYDLIWQPLEEEINEAQRIYFSPTSLLHEIPVESLMNKFGESLSDRHLVYRLTSTKALLEQAKNVEQGLILYGGIDYNASSEEIKQINNSNGLQKTDPLLINKEHRVGMKPLKYLPGSRNEVLNIEKIVQKSMKCDLYTGASATEESFKQLSGTKPNIIHAATHGFYLEESKFLNQDLGNISQVIKNLKTFEDKVLTRSGLYFAGCNKFISSNTINEGTEDGILNSLEISKLDLSETDLVVLSACQSGSGELNGDGIWGLQRGFKKAGVQSLLITLWNVNDHATQLFMENFYETFVTGKTKNESFHNAQRFLMNYSDESGKRIYNQPEYWAAYILLDTLD